MKYQVNSKKNNYKQLLFIAITILLVISVALAIAIGLKQQSQVLTASSSNVNALAPKAAQNDTQVSLDIHMLFVGDVFWGRGIEYYSNKNYLKYAYPFSGLSPEDRKQYNAWIGNMECPVTNRDIPYQTQVQYLQLNCRPEFLPEAAKWFTAVSLANNHTNNNNGEWGMTQTRTNLAANNIQYYGDYNMRNTSAICEVVAVPANLSNDTTTSKSAHVPVALCGYDYVGSVQPKQDEFEIMREYTKVMPVIAVPHMGTEFRNTAEQSKVDTYRKMIDSGADMVVASHPHVVQNSENYKGRLIAYSMGNFIFDQQSVSRDTVLSLGVGIKISTNDKSAIAAYTATTDCEKAHDNCLLQLQATLKQRPKFDVSYNAECFEQSSNIPKKANQLTCNEILTKATWQSASANLASQW